MEFALAAITLSLFAFLLSLFTFFSLREHQQGLPEGRDWSNEPHAHQYTKMFADGKGWRCGVCGMPKPKED